MAEDVKAELDKARKKRRVAATAQGKSHMAPVATAPEMVPTPVEDPEHTMDDSDASSIKSQVSSLAISNNLIEPELTHI